MSNVKSAFDEALEERKRRKQEAEDAKNSYSGGGGYEEVKFLGFEDNKEIVFRIVGNPDESRRNPGDAKAILRSDILKSDKKGYTKIIWPTVVKGEKIKPDDDWILTRVFNKIQEGSWPEYDESFLKEPGFKKTSDGKIVNSRGWGSYKKYDHTDTESFHLISKEGNSKKGEKYPKGATPGLFYLINVIDRLDDWCKENKHTKVLTNKVYTDDDGGNERVYSPGISKTVYDKIFNYYMDFKDDWWSSDAIIKKYATGEGNKRDYIIKDSSDKPEKLSKLPDEVRSRLSADPITKEESEYELYDFDFLYKPASYSKLKKNLFGLFKQVDADFGTTFVEELEELVREEMAEIAEKKEENKEIESDVKDVKTDVSKEVEEAEVEVEAEETEKVEEEPKRSRRAEPESKAEGNQMSEESILKTCEAIYKNWDKVSSKQQKNFINAIESFEGTVPVWKKGIDTEFCANKDCTFPESDVQTVFPINVITCAVCGTEDKD